MEFINMKDEFKKKAAEWAAANCDKEDSAIPYAAFLIDFIGVETPNGETVSRGLLDDFGKDMEEELYRVTCARDLAKVEARLAERNSQELRQMVRIGCKEKSYDVADVIALIREFIEAARLKSGHGDTMNTLFATVLSDEILDKVEAHFKGGADGEIL